jgi:branched-chain amino acid transport system substrate-binding protein
VVDGFDRGRQDSALQKFFAEFQKRAGYPPENVAAITYSAVKLMADAITRAKSADPAKVRDALAVTKNYPLLTGDLIGFNKLHEVIMPININVVKNGKFVSFAKLDDLAAFAPPDK